MNVIKIQTLESRDPLLISLTYEQTIWPLWKVAKELICPMLKTHPKQLYKQFRLLLPMFDGQYTDFVHEHRFLSLNDLPTMKVSVIRRLTTGQSIQTIPSKLITESTPISGECSICTHIFDSNTITNCPDEKAYVYGYVMECGHRFCYPCIKQWIETRQIEENISSCPNCRQMCPTQYLHSDIVHAYSCAYGDLLSQYQAAKFPVQIDFHKHWNLLKQNV